MSEAFSASQHEHTNRGWKIVYLIGGWAAIIAPVIFRRYYAAEFMAFNGFGVFEVPEVSPVSALEWFELLINNQFVGLVLLNILDLINYVLVGLMFVALYGALRQVSRWWVSMATLLCLVGVVVFIATNQAFPLLALSNEYAAAATAVEQAALLEAGEALLAIDNPGKVPPGFGSTLGLFLVTVAGLIMSIVMLCSTVFNKITGWMGLLANLILLPLFAAFVFAPMFFTTPPVVLYAIPPSVSALFRVAWYLMFGVRLLKLRRI